MFGCGTPSANLVISAPSTSVAGSPFTVTVTAMAGGSRDTIINSPIQFSSSDRAAVLPGIYYFTANDAGSHTFPNGVTLMTPGSQSITATVIGASGLNGSTNVTVTAASTATRLKVSAPRQQGRGQLSLTKIALVNGYGGTVHSTSSTPTAIIPSH